MKKIVLIATLMVGSLFAQTQSQTAPVTVPNNKFTKVANNPVPNNKFTKVANNPVSDITIKQGSKEGRNISKTPGLINNCILTIEASGIGVAPEDSISVAQATAMARRAAIIDGYKALTEKLYGIKVNGRETVKDMVLKDSTLHSRIAGIIRGAVIEDENYKNGMYEVVMSLKLNVKNWNQYLKNNPPYAN